jgi:DNA-binding transcriptional MerR regulator
MSKDLTFGEAAKAVDLSVDAVRFYERQGIMASPPRMAGGRPAGLTARNKWLNSPSLPAGRAVRMPLSEIGRYLSLARQGEATLPERMRIITAQREKVVEQIASLQETLRVLDLKLSRAAEIAKVATTPRRSGLQIARGGKDRR